MELILTLWMELIYLLFSCPQLCAHNCVWHLNCVRQCALTIATQDNPADLCQLRHWLQFLQLRTWIHDNFCYLTFKSDSGQHSQFLQCFCIFTFLSLFEWFRNTLKLLWKCISNTSVTMALWNGDNTIFGNLFESWKYVEGT